VNKIAPHAFAQLWSGEWLSVLDGQEDPERGLRQDYAEQKGAEGHDETSDHGDPRSESGRFGDSETPL
jgi:hypothetical protein